jgi:hypothetical protein
MKAAGLRFLLPLVALALLADASVRAERFLRGQNIAPVYEGWRRNPDGTIAMLFGYLNRNYEETLDVPVGLNNQFAPGEPDRGQPTHFLTRRQRFVFEVTVPRDWEPKQRLIWTVVANGRTEKAQGWLQPEWEFDEGVIEMNLGGGSAPPDPPNAGPTISGTDGDQSVKVSQPLSLTAAATDDGIPRPRKAAGNVVAGSAGVTIRWIQYRGPGKVTFSAAQSDRVYGTPVELTTKATFSAPGLYVLRAIASDGLLESSHRVNVTVR